MTNSFSIINGRIKPIGDKVIVENMYFGETKTKSGLVILDDNGTDRGIKPRWAQIYAKGDQNKEPYNVGDWILVEHGRWTRGVRIDDQGKERIVRLVDTNDILMYSEECPE